MKISGTVRSSTDDSPLPMATIRILGTLQATISDMQGRFTMTADRLPVSLVISYLGFKTDTVVFREADSMKNILLSEEEIVYPEVLITGEDPAVAIMKEVIASKKRMKNKFNSFTAETYAKETFRSDKRVFLLFESYSTLYRNDIGNSQEIIRKRKDIKSDFSALPPASVDEFIDFNEDTVLFWGHRFIGPTHPDLFSWYDCLLRKTFIRNSNKIFEIELIPKSVIHPLFRGTIVVNDSSYRMESVSLEANESVSIPFYSIEKLLFRQSIDIYAGRLYLPVNYSVSASLGFKMDVVPNKKLGFYYDKHVVCYNYSLNSAGLDTLSQPRRLVVLPEAGIFDSSYWTQNAVLPLTEAEELAYRNPPKPLDDPVTKLFKYIEWYKENERYIDFRANRVEGIFFGAILPLTPVLDGVRIGGSLGVGEADERWKYSARSSFGPEYLHGEVCYAHSVRTIPWNVHYSPGLAGLTMLLDHNDYYDYFDAYGWSASINYRPSSSISFSIKIDAEMHASLDKKTEMGGIASLHTYPPYRENPLISDRRWRTLSSDLEFGRTVENAWMPEKYFFRWLTEYSDKKTLGSAADYFFTAILFSEKFDIIQSSLLKNPYVKVEGMGIWSSGSVPVERYAGLRSTLSGYAPGAAFRCTYSTEFLGSSGYSLLIENNLRRLPFQLSFLPFIKNLDLDFILTAAVARLSSHETSPSIPYRGTPDIYYESGIAVGGLLGVFRFDCTYRGAAPKGLSFSFSASIN